MWEITDLDVREATFGEQRLMPLGVPDRDVAFNLPEDAPLAEALHEVVAIGRVQVESRSRLEGAVDGAEDAQELLVVDVLREVEGKAGVKLIGMPGAEGDDVGAVEGAAAGGR